MSKARTGEDRRALKLRKKSDDRGVEFGVVKAEFNVERKSVGRKQVYDPDYGTFYEGHTSIFNTEDSYRDVIMPGAFKASIRDKGPRLDKKSGYLDSDIPSLWQHNPDWPFGFTAVLQEDSIGLYHRTHIPVNDTNMERLDWIESRIVKGESIGFITLDAEWDEEEEDEYWPIRRIKEIDLWEHSAVTFPAHSDALTELVQRNREIALAVKSTNHAAVLETAAQMKGMTLPAIEEAIALFKQVLKSQEADEDTEGDTRTGDVDAEAEAQVETETEVAAAAEVEEGPVETGDTSGDDPELVKALEVFAFQMTAERLERSIKSRR
jgi:HK97 family phage prohead protease